MAKKNDPVFTYEFERLKQAYVDFVRRRDWLNDYFVTLTFDSGSQYHPVISSDAIKQYLRMLERALLGRRATKQGKKLYRYSVFEYSKSGELHIHMLLENPGSIYLDEAKHEQVIIDTWMKMKCSGYKGANKVLLVERTPELLYDYLHKTIRPKNVTMIDPELWHLPTDSSQCDALGSIESPLNL